MRVSTFACIVFALTSPMIATAQFKGYFDVNHLMIEGLATSDWGRRVEVDRLLYVCTNYEKCPPPTAIEIKGVLRNEELPAAFEANGALSPAKLFAQGRANAQRTGSRFITAEHVTVAGVKGVHMEASAGRGQSIYFVTRWIGEGDRMLDIKATATDLDEARRLVDAATRQLVPQVFKNPIKI